MTQFIQMTLYDFASRDIGVREFAGGLDNPLIMAMLKLTGDDGWTGWPLHDEVPWCSAAMNFWCRYLRLPRSKSLQARSWLGVGRAIDISEATAMNDIVIFKQGSGEGSATADVIYRDGTYPPGHVACFSRLDGVDTIWALGANQGNMVSVAPFKLDDLIGVRRLY